MKLPTKILALLLLIALVSLCAYSYLEANKHSPYPGTGEIKSNYQSYVDKQITIFGDVTAINGDAAIVSSDGLNFNVQPINAAVGDKVEVLGVLGEEYNITATEVLTYDRLSYYAVFLRSLVGAGVLAVFFLKNWAPNFKKFRFEERG